MIDRTVAIVTAPAMTLAEISAELQLLDRELRDLREALDDADDGAATRIRQVIHARLRRQEELESMRSTTLSVGA